VPREESYESPKRRRASSEQPPAISLPGEGPRVVRAPSIIRKTFMSSPDLVAEVKEGDLSLSGPVLSVTLRTKMPRFTFSKKISFTVRNKMKRKRNRGGSVSSNAVARSVRGALVNALSNSSLLTPRSEASFAANFKTKSQRGSKSGAGNKTRGSQTLLPDLDRQSNALSPSINSMEANAPVNPHDNMIGQQSPLRLSPAGSPANEVPSTSRQASVNSNPRSVASSRSEPTGGRGRKSRKKKRSRKHKVDELGDHGSYESPHDRLDGHMSPGPPVRRRNWKDYQRSKSSRSTGHLPDVSNTIRSPSGQRAVHKRRNSGSSDSYTSGSRSRRKSKKKGGGKTPKDTSQNHVYPEPDMPHPRKDKLRPVATRKYKSSPAGKLPRAASDSEDTPNDGQFYRGAGGAQAEPRVVTAVGTLRPLKSQKVYKGVREMPNHLMVNPKKQRSFSTQNIPTSELARATRKKKPRRGSSPFITPVSRLPKAMLGGARQERLAGQDMPRNSKRSRPERVGTTTKSNERPERRHRRARSGGRPLTVLAATVSEPLTHNRRAKTPNPPKRSQRVVANHMNWESVSARSENESVDGLGTRQNSSRSDGVTPQPRDSGRRDSRRRGKSKTKRPKVQASASDGSDYGARRQKTDNRGKEYYTQALESVESPVLSVSGDEEMKLETRKSKRKSRKSRSTRKKSRKKLTSKPAAE